MVKGSAKRVVVVESPDKRFFEQAIFIVGEAARGVTSRELLEEARRVAKGYTGEVKRPRRWNWSPVLYTALGSGVTALAWLATAYL